MAEAQEQPRQPARADKEARSAALIDAALAGDEAGFTGLFQLWRHDVQRIIFGCVGQAAEMEDILQVTFMEVFRSLGHFERKSKFSTWLYRITVNVAYQHLRRKGRELPHVDPEEAPVVADTAPTPHEAAEHRQLLALSREILQRMGGKKREVFVLHELEGFSSGEIAEMLHTSVHTVKSRLWHARREFYPKLDRLLTRESGGK